MSNKTVSMRKKGILTIAVPPREMAEKAEQTLSRLVKAIMRFTVLGRTGLLIVMLFLFFSIIYAVLGLDAHTVPSGASLEPPSFSHPLGTDDLGIDLLAQIGRGMMTSLLVGFGSALLAGLGGGLWGVWAGYYGGLTDKLVSALSDIMLCIPQLPLIIVIGAFFGSSLQNIILVIALFSWAGPAKQCRTRILSVRNERYVTAAKSYGAGFLHIAGKHLLPAVLPIIFVSMMRIVSHAVITEAGLAFLGLGDPTSKSLGLVLNRSINFAGIYYTDYWQWWITAPLCALLMLVASIAYISRDLERIANPKL